VQGLFLALLGEKSADVQTLLRANLEELHMAIPDFRSYTAPGTAHTILEHPGLFTVEVEGVALASWLADFAAGKPVADVDCVRDNEGCLPPS
jgi:hypothetical protein